MADLTGQVHTGINNIYTVEADGRRFQCRIKGKVLRSEEREYNPIAVGDRVTIRPDPYSPEVAWIMDRLPRTSTPALEPQAPRAAGHRGERRPAGLRDLGPVPALPAALPRPAGDQRAHGDLAPVIVLNKIDLAGGGHRRAARRTTAASATG